MSCEQWKWLPIATAPKDGTDYLIYCPETRKTLSVRYDEATADWWPVCADVTPQRNRAVVVDCGFGEPSHWMPLPTPPTDGDAP